MNDWRFLRTGRWAGYLVLTIVFAVACAALGTWQLNRRAEALAEVARIDANYDADPVPVAEALPDPAAFDVDQRWQVVALSGTYLADEEVVVRNRPFEGSTGFEVMTPFELDDGTVFMVDRGWIAQDSAGRPSDTAAPPPATSRSRRGSRRVRAASPAEPRRASSSRRSTSTNSPRGSASRATRVPTGCSCNRRRMPQNRHSPPPARCATRGPTCRMRCNGSCSPCSGSSGSAGRRTRSARGSPRHPEPRTPRSRRRANRSVRDGSAEMQMWKTRSSIVGDAQASSMSSWYSLLQWSSVPSGMMRTRSGFSASTAPGSCETSTTEPS